MSQYASNVKKNKPFLPLPSEMTDSQIELLDEAYVALSGGLVSDEQHNELALLPDNVRADIEVALLEQLPESEYKAWFGTGRFRDYERAATDIEPELVVSFELPSSRVQSPAVTLDNVGWRGFTKPWIDAFLAAGIDLPVEPESSAEPASDNGVEASQEPVRASVEPIQVNDALFIGGDLPTSVYNLPLNIGIAGGRDAKRWPGKKMRWGEFVASLTKHAVGEKDGKAFIQGTAIGNERKAKAMEQMCIVGLDFDSGIHMEPIAEKIQNELGLSAVLYTTHSHHTTETHVVQSSYAQWARKNRLGEEPTEATMKKYMREAKKWEPWVSDSITLAEDAIHTKDGISYVLTHLPMPKFRVVFVLSEPYVIAKQRMSQKAATDLWKGRLLGLAKILGVPIDEACLDPSRLFYLLRHKEGRPFKIIVTSGNALDFNAIPALMPNGKGGQKPDDNIYAEAARNLGASDGANFMFGDFSLKNWAREAAGSFDIAAMFRDVAETKIRSDDGADKLEIECPCDFEHSNAGDTDDRGAWVQSAHAEGSETGFSWGCQHNSCKGRDRLAFVCEALKSEWFTTADLENETYRIFTVEEAEQAETKLPNPFVRKPDGIFYKRFKDDEPVYDFVCDPFTVVGHARDEHGNGAALVIEFTNLGVTKHARILMADLQAGSSAVRAKLADMGLTISANSTMRNRFDELVSLMSSDKHILTTTRAGFHEWKGTTVFVAPNGQALDCNNARGDVMLSDVVTIMDPAPKGSLEKWRAAAGAVAKVGNHHWVIGLCSGFAGPIIARLGLPSSGIIATGKSSRGKSTMQGLGASVWGPPIPREGHGVYWSASTTPNAVENLAAIGHGSLLALDELGHMDPEGIGKLIFLLAQGAGKARQSKEGALRAIKSWATFVTLSSKVSASELMKMANKRMLTGQAVRLPTVDVSAMRGVTPEEFAAIDSYKEHYGHAWRPYVEHLFSAGYVAKPEKLRERLNEAVLNLSGSSADSTTRRAAIPFALLRVGGEIAQEAGILPDDMDTKAATEWAWDSYLNGEEAQALDSDDQALAIMRETLQAGWGSDIKELQPNDDVAEAYREARWGWFDDESIYIRKSKLAELAGRGGTPQSIAKELKERGMLKCHKRTLHNEYLKKRGTLPHYELDRAKFLGAGDLAKA